MALEMLWEGLNVDRIVKFTGFTFRKVEILELQKNLNKE